MLSIYSFIVIQYNKTQLSCFVTVPAATTAELSQNPSCTANSGFQMGTNLCETPSNFSSPLGYQGATVHQFVLLWTSDWCSLLPLPSSAAVWEEKTSLSFLSTSIQQWRTKLPLSESVSLDIPLVTRHVCSLQRCSAAQWLALLNNGDKSSLSCQSGIKTSPGQRAGRAAAVLRGWRLSPKDARLLLCRVYKASGFYATFGSVGSC